jgi:probable rRNA maturation factor
MPDPGPLLDFQITSASWRRIPHLRARLKDAVRATAKHLPKKFRFPASCTVLLAGDAKIRQLNHDFRGMDKATNVLSFPQFSPLELAKFGKQKGVIELGDIALAYAYTLKEAKKNNKLMLNHVTHLMIHGFLHLFGYDHGSAKEANMMENMEIKIMKSLGLHNPYAPLPSGRKRTP